MTEGSLLLKLVHDGNRFMTEIGSWLKSVHEAMLLFISGKV